ncbi:hypothetical protein DSO57_1019668 [Entomophthora muscae]|uniref:Uncharacterized protein n=1 Tax=Entomophthora muscae TaxID=34485 RepID=A0ACC2RIH9_9FUNG|nr:hypothetical protein DSO57_1019668 [Entomophthora muscae]
MNDKPIDFYFAGFLNDTPPFAGPCNLAIKPEADHPSPLALNPANRPLTSLIALGLAPDPAPKWDTCQKRQLANLAHRQLINYNPAFNLYAQSAQMESSWAGNGIHSINWADAAPLGQASNNQTIQKAPTEYMRMLPATAFPRMPSV